VRVAPITAFRYPFSDSIKSASPTFVEIYDQAIAAESHDLSQLVGIGLRKSLEFLVKDFASAQHPDKEDEIKQMQLGPCISAYIEDPNVKGCAKLAAWLAQLPQLAPIFADSGGL